MLSAEELETANENVNSRKPFDPYLRFVEMPFTAVFYPLGFPLEFSTNSEDILGAAYECWGEFRQQFDTPPLKFRIGLVEDGSKVCPPGPNARAHRGIIVRIADQDNFHVADLAQNDSFAWVTTATVLHRSYLRYHFLEAVALTHIAGCQTAAIHAACVELNGHGVLLCGESGAGKSSLAFACARAGWTYITDDASFLLHGRSDRKVVGNCHLIRLRPSAAELFAEVEGKPQTQRAEGKPSIELFTSSMPEITTAGSAEIDCVIFLNRSTGNRGEFTQFPREEARRYMHQNLCGLDDFRKEQLRSVERLLTADTFKLHYCDLDQAVEQLGRLVRERG
jgi:hypothetical protein